MYMQKQSLSTLILGVLIFGLAFPAQSAQNFAVAELHTRGVTKTLMLPENVLRSPVISLGTALDAESGEMVEGYAIIHHKDEHARVEKPVKPTATVCYAYLARDAKWKTVEQWVFNGANTSGLDNVSSFNAINQSVLKWEDAADGIVGNNLGVNILGDGLITSDLLLADTVAPDGLNEVYFANISDSNAIAITIVWGVFGGAPSQRKLVEWDQIYNDADFTWSLAGEAGKMDLENIATHELGHSAGMADMYTSACAEETMYGYASNGETKKRDLYNGDIEGINKLY